MTDLANFFLTPEEAEAMAGRRGTQAAVLLALYGWPEEPGLIFTERRADLAAAALREAEEEIALDPAAVELTGALAPVSTFVTGYRVHPFVGVVPHPQELDLRPNPSEVETVLTFSLDRLREGYEMRRLIRRGVPIHTPTYEVDGRLIWGATARILGELLERLG
jgi:8-oxo-dGTP pyrophosphatase MutT (NUDIX family)